MFLSKLQINHVRNLRDVSLEGLKPVNVLYGDNGSGKTSALEAINLLAMARSFRGNSVRTLITHGEQRCTVFGSVGKSHQSDIVKAVGVQKTQTGETRIKVAGDPLKTAAELVKMMPLQVITANSMGFLTGAPGLRRQYLDWGVFHVEQRFFAEWQRFQRCMKQRNKLLRRDKITDSELSVWTRDLATSGELLTRYRERYFERLRPCFYHMIKQMDECTWGAELDLAFRQGWDKKFEYATALEHGLRSDREGGYTHLGPQRADIRMSCGGHSAAEMLSRGQQKLAVCALKLAQGQMMSESGVDQCAYLVDDLPAELDAPHRERVCELLASLQAQVFITCIKPEEVYSAWPDTAQVALFHVEHGNITRKMA